MADLSGRAILEKPGKGYKINYTVFVENVNLASSQCKCIKEFYTWIIWIVFCEKCVVLIKIIAARKS